MENSNKIEELQERVKSPVQRLDDYLPVLFEPHPHLRRGLDLKRERRVLYYGLREVNEELAILAPEDAAYAFPDHAHASLMEIMEYNLLCIVINILMTCDNR